MGRGENEVHLLNDRAHKLGEVRKVVSRRPPHSLLQVFEKKTMLRLALQLNFKLQHFPVRQLAGPDRSGNFPDRTDQATFQRHAIVSNAIIPQH